MNRNKFSPCFFIFVFLCYLISGNCERNVPSKYWQQRGRVFMHEVTEFGFNFPSGVIKQEYGFNVSVNGIKSVERKILLNKNTHNKLDMTKNYLLGEDLGDYAFTKIIYFRIDCFHPSDFHLIDFINIKLQLTKGIPHHLNNITGQNGVMAFKMSFMVRCDTYTGINCFIPISDTKNSVTKINHFTGEVQCRNGNNDPPTCSNSPHLPGRGKCKNGGILIASSVNFQTYCNCPTGYRGDLCEEFFCGKFCYEPRGECVGPSNCKCLPGYSGTSCQSPTCETYNKCLNGDCLIANGLPICACKKDFFGDICQYSCKQKCQHGICYAEEKKTHCQCEVGFTGIGCEISILEKDILTNKEQKTSRATSILAGTLASTIIICLICLFIQFDWGNKAKKLIRKEIKKHARIQISEMTMNPTQGRKNMTRNPMSGSPDLDDETFDELEVQYDQMEGERYSYTD